MYIIKQLQLAHKQYKFKGLFIQLNFYFQILLAKNQIGKKQTCPGCNEKNVVFLPLLVQPVQVRKNFSCPKCSITFRHSYYAELSKKYILGHLDLNNELNIYHFIPEEGLVNFWKKSLPNFKYHLTCYPENMEGYELLDITNIKLTSESVDLIIINHVLSCTPDISQAFIEIHRILKPNGIAIIGESVYEDKTTKELTKFNPYGTRYRTFGRLDLQELVSPFKSFSILRDEKIIEKYLPEISKEESIIFLKKE